MPELEWDTDDFVLKSRAASLRALTLAADLVRTEIVRLILETPKTGREYRRRGITHVASAPGEPPASDTGNLVRSVVVEVNDQDLTLKITNTAEYASALEFGTPKMEARPFMRIALANKREEITNLLQTELDAAFEA